MKVVAFLCALFLAQAQAAQGQDFSKGTWVDLTHPFNEASVYWRSFPDNGGLPAERGANSIATLQPLLTS